VAVAARHDRGLRRPLARRRSLEETLQALRGVREQPESEASSRELRRILESDSSHAVARAAALVGEAGLVALAPELVAAFPRFFAALPKSDPGCSAKTAIVEALRRLGRDEAAVYRRAARHVQMEPVFGGRVDTAVDLRSAAALALAEQGGRDVLALLAELLADPEPPVRIAAARAVAVHGNGAGVPLLRLKVLSPEPEPRVVTECLLALLRLDESGELAFVASFLGKPDALAEAGALALGESRLPKAFEALCDWLPAARQRGLARTALLAVASLRRDEATAWLLALVRDEPPALAREALAALATLGPTVSERALVAAAVRAELQSAVEKLFKR
jgi:hypothetical protein